MTSDIEKKWNAQLERNWHAEQSAPYTLGKCTECGKIVSSKTKFTVCDDCWYSPTFDNARKGAKDLNIPPEFLQQ
jgi:ABC-type ATPase with predicted acetyltransferase domain